MTAAAAETQPAQRPATINGQVEGLAGAALTGWAIDLARSAPCGIVVRDAAGAEVAHGRADQWRSDLGSHGFGRSDFGFRLVITSLGQNGALHIYADDVELAGSPLATGAGHYDGALALQDGWAEGWVHERQMEFEPPVVTLLDQDDVCVGTDLAVLVPGNPVFTPARFRIPLRQAAWARPELALRAAVNGVTFATTYTRLTLHGHLDVLTDGRCAGWLLCPQAPSVRFGIEAFRDGQRVGTGAAVLGRDDLREMHPQSWKTGFDFDLIPAATATDHAVTLSLRLADTTSDLFGGPFLLGSRRHLACIAKNVAGIAQGMPGLSDIERAVVQGALTDYIGRCRDDVSGREQRKASISRPAPPSRRFTVVIPIYRDVSGTRACIDSVLAHRDPHTDAVVLVNDASPDEGMAELLDGYRDLPHVHVLTNAINVGFVQTANRGFEFCHAGDVVMLNSDTVVFAGALAEMWSVAHAQPSIGTVTALSNNATIFSYPVADRGGPELEDIGWAEIAAAALAGNRGRVVDVPTGHGFCLLITRSLLERVERFDQSFGRGYGEENDLCLRGADLGLRNVAACGAFVEHRESMSFGHEKSALLGVNLPLLQQRYPEYAAEVRDYLRRDDLRTARWTIDAHRLARAITMHGSAGGGGFVLVIRNWLDGGTRKAIQAVEAQRLGDRASSLDLCVQIDGAIHLSCKTPLLAAVFAPGEQAALFAMLEQAAIDIVEIHQLLGYTAHFVAALHRWISGRDARVTVHDFYTLCPRVTMIDAIGAFCDVAPAEVCARCVEMGGTHDASRMDELTPAEHRALFADLLRAARTVAAPSRSAAAYMHRVFPDVPMRVSPHPEPPEDYRVALRSGSADNVVLLGALGPHKGSAKLLEIAQRARMIAPQLHFHLIGYSDLDTQLRATGNVSVSGKYAPAEQAGLISASHARVALFLHRWPETFSYTLSEAVQLGLVPLVPDIGAPAERVRAAGFGHVFGFPVNAIEVVDLLLAISTGKIALAADGAYPENFAALSSPVPTEVMRAEAATA